MVHLAAGKTQGDFRGNDLSLVQNQETGFLKGFLISVPGGGPGRSIHSPQVRMNEFPKERACPREERWFRPDGIP